MRLIKVEDVCEMLDIIADSKAITTKHGAIAIVKTGLDDIPTIDPESLRPQGMWKYIAGSEEEWKGTHCKEIYVIPPGCHPAVDCGMIYCMNCGAKMNGGDSR